MRWQGACLRGAVVGLALVLGAMLEGLGPPQVQAAGPPQGSAGAPAQAQDACADTGWQRITMGSEVAPVWALATAPEGDLAMAGTPQVSAAGHSLFRGRPRDLAWAGVADLQGVPVAATAIALGPGRDIWVGAIGALGNAYLSQDGGLTFSTFQSPLELRGVASMVMAGGVDGVVAAAYRGAELPVVLRWDGMTWGAFGDLTGVHAGGPRMLWDVALGRDGRGWLSVDARGLWRLDDRLTGAWQPVGDTSLTLSTVLTILADPYNFSRVFVGLGPSFANPGAAYQRGVRVSVDNGESWGPATLTEAERVTALALTSGEGDTHADGILFAGTWGQGLWQSGDGGASWRHVPGPPDPFVRRLQVVVPAGQSVTTCELLVAGTNAGLFARNLARARDFTVFLPQVARDWDR